MERVPPFEPAPGPEYRYELVAAHLAARIRAGEIPPGSRLPGEMSLRDEYGVSLDTVRKALALLRRQGLAVTRASLGTFVVRELPPPEG